MKLIIIFVVNHLKFEFTKQKRFLKLEKKNQGNKKLTEANCFNDIDYLKYLDTVYNLHKLPIFGIFEKIC